VNLKPDDTQEQLRTAVRAWVEKQYPFEVRQRIRASGGFCRTAYAGMAELGLCGLLVAESQGGLGLGDVEAMAVMEELGCGLVLEPLRDVLVCSRLLQVHAGARAWAQALLADISAGRRLVVLAHHERDARYAREAIDTRARRAGDGWTVTGAKSLVAAGDVADGFLVSARSDEGEPALFHVAADAAGVEARGHLLQDGSRAADLRLSGCEAQLVTRDGREALAQAWAQGLAAVCAQGVGVMSKVMKVTVEHLRTRKQFGVPIGKFQVLRHYLADMHLQHETARCMSAYATLCLQDDAEARQLAVAQAKYQLGVAMRFVGQHAVQIHGGMGLVDEYVVSHLFTTLTQLELTLADSASCLDAMSRGMTPTVASVLRARPTRPAGAAAC
jgi:alkylation response protein AidB-like acyl-CoA dehydrogenase